MSMVENEDDEDARKRVTVQSRVLQILKSTDCSLNVVNRYRENIVHVCAANDCVELLEFIERKYGKHCLERKNAFGWTPIMQAIRNENLSSLRFLLGRGVAVNDFSFLGLSVMSLASAISVEVFEMIHESSPSALEYAARDDINPLCIAALKNDERLFSRLLELGVDASQANPFTLTMMKQSTVPRIQSMVESHLNSMDYWNDISDIKDLLVEDQIVENKNDVLTLSDVEELDPRFDIPQLFVDGVKVKSMDNPDNLDRKNRKGQSHSMSLISPVLSYFNVEFPPPASPSTFITPNNVANDMKNLAIRLNLEVNEKVSPSRQVRPSTSPVSQETSEPVSSPLVLQRCKDKRPPNLNLRCSSNDSNDTLSFTPQFSPSKSPNLPKNASEDNIFDEDTPTPPRYRTPPRGIILDESTKRLMLVLKKFGLSRHARIFIDQEVDYDLFLTLTDADLIEIGIESKSERLILLSVIQECKC